MSTKICRVCKVEKNLDEFYKAKQNKDGYRYDCKNCGNKEKIKYIKKRYARDSEFRKKSLERSSKYSKENRPKINAALRKRYSEDEEYRKKTLESVKKSQDKKDNGFKGLPEDEQLLLMQDFMLQGIKKSSQDL
jgi:hypothetical protein